MRALNLLTISVLIVVGAASAHAAEGKETLSLEQAIQLALGNNHLLGAAEAGMQASKERLSQANAHRLPGVSLNGTVSRTTNPVMVFGGLLGQERFGAEHFDPVFLNNPDALDNFSLTLALEQPIYAGGKIAGGIRATEFAAQAAAFDQSRARQQIVRQVVDAYSGAVLARSHLDVAREARKTTAAHVKLVQDLFEGGLVVKSDLLQAQVRESEVEEMVIQAEAGLAIGRAALNVAMGMDSGHAFSLPAEFAVDLSGDESLETLIPAAIAARPDLAAAEARAKAAGEMTRIARADYLPEVGVGGSFQANDESFFGTNGTNWSVAVVAKMKIFDGLGTRARVQEARQNARAAEHMSQFAAQAVELEVRQSYHQLRAARQRMAQATKAITLATESLRIVEDRYRNGLTTLVELLDAETSLTAAKTRNVAARRDLLLSQATLNLAVGRE